MNAEEGLKLYVAELHKEQESRDQHLDEELKLLLNDLVKTKDVKRLLGLLKNNKKQIQYLQNSKSLSSKHLSVVNVLNTQLLEMNKLLIAQEKNLVAYKKSAEEKLRNHKKGAFIYKTKLDRLLSSSDLQASNSDSAALVEEEFVFKLGNAQKLEAVVDHAGRSMPILKNLNSQKKKPVKLVSSIKKHPDGRDDLTVISKISSKLESLLNSKGITTIAQIAEWTPQDVKARDARLVFRGRIAQEKWVEQAKVLMGNIR